MSRLIRTARRALCALALAAPFALPFTAASAQTFELTGVTNASCTDGDFLMSFQQTDAPAGSVVRTVATIDGLVYMNQSWGVSGSNSANDWGLHNDFSYGAVPNRGTWPMPEDRPLYIDVTLEQPVGTVLHRHRLEVDGCNTGNIVFNGAATLFDLNPTVSVPAAATFVCDPNPTAENATATCTLDITDPGYVLDNFENCVRAGSSLQCTIGPINSGISRDIVANLRVRAPASAVPVPVNAPLMLVMLAGLLGFAAHRSRKTRK